MLFRKRRKTHSDSKLSIEAQRDLSAAKWNNLRELNDDFLQWLRDFALDEEDIDSAGFQIKIEELRADLKRIGESDQPSHSVRKQADFIPGFIARQQQHLKVRDNELRDVVSVLTRAVIEMNSRNDNYNSAMHEQIETITSLSRIEDIRKLRTGLISEIGRLREMLEKKQEVEISSIKSLSGQVEVLRDELKQAQEESRRDGLTGTYNRKALDSYIDGLLDAGGSRRNRFALLMLDLDNFKFINDQHGHLVGDRVLVALVDICRNVIRSEDFLGRYGGDEFAIVFPGASARVVARKGREICDIINSRIFTLEEKSGEHAPKLSLSVSIGVTECKSGDTYKDLIGRADVALYEAKRSGKNCVKTG